MAESVLVAETAGVRTLTLNRPDRRNALTPEMQQELIAALTAAEQSSTTRVVVLTGAGEAFCAGLDLATLVALKSRTTVELADDAQRIATMFRTLYECTVPTIAAVNGHAVAGGTGLATLCDFTYAVPAAKFGYTEVKIGFVPALVSAYLSLQVGEKRARDLLLTGRLFGAEEAQQLGLVSEVVAPERLAERVEAQAALLAASSASSLRMTKRLLADQNRTWLDQAIACSLEANARSRETADFEEGVAAFLEKRKPNWS